MPTGPKAVAAVLLGALGLVTSLMMLDYLPPIDIMPSYVLFCAVIGVMCGWFGLGPRTEARIGIGLSAGITWMLVMTFAMVFLQNFYQMIDRSLALRYRGLEAAINGILTIYGENADMFGDTTLLATLGLGGALAGVLTAVAAQRWN